MKIAWVYEDDNIVYIEENDKMLVRPDAWCIVDRFETKFTESAAEFLIPEQRRFAQAV